MSTRSVIGYLNEDETVTAVYCHCDGYPKYNGRILINYYNTPELAKALVNLGGLSYIAPRLAPEPHERHSFDMPANEVTVAYHRDRGEELQIEKYDNLKQLLREARTTYWAEYVYVYSPDGWKCYDAYDVTTIYDLEKYKEEV